MNFKLRRTGRWTAAKSVYQQVAVHLMLGRLGCNRLRDCPQADLCPAFTFCMKPISQASVVIIPAVFQWVKLVTRTDLKGWEDRLLEAGSRTGMKPFA